MEFLKIILSVFSGGVIIELLKICYPDLKKIINRKREAKKILNKYCEAILKSSDELFGKIYSLAKSDFLFFKNYEDTKDEINKIYILYLFANFWANLSILKQESDLVNLARIKDGKRLLMFVTSYESKKNRILDRALQRAIGESLIIKNSSNLRTLNFYEFINEYRDINSDIRKVITPLEHSIFQTIDPINRQKYLFFGIIIQSIIDFLDKNHKVVRDRKPYINKLNEKTKCELKYRLFNEYLPFIKNCEKYYKE